jgi:hypothetical protein
LPGSTSEMLRLPLGELAEQELGHELIERHAERAAEAPVVLYLRGLRAYRALRIFTKSHSARVTPGRQCEHGLEV